MMMKLLNRAVLLCLVSFGTYALPLHGFERGFFDYRYASPRHERCRMDVIEKDKEYAVVIEVPGIKKDEIDLSYVDSMLIINFSSSEQNEDQDANYLRRERMISAFSRNIRLPDAKFEKAEAVLADGVLRINIPREKGTENCKKIQIK